MYAAEVVPAIKLILKDGLEVIYYREDWDLRNLQILLQYDEDEWNSDYMDM